MVVRVGTGAGGAYPLTSVAPGTAVPVFLDFIDTAIGARGLPFPGDGGARRRRLSTGNAVMVERASTAVAGSASDVTAAKLVRGRSAGRGLRGLKDVQPSDTYDTYEKGSSSDEKKDANASAKDDASKRDGIETQGPANFDDFSKSEEHSTAFETTNEAVDDNPAAAAAETMDASSTGSGSESPLQPTGAPDAPYSSATAALSSDPAAVPAAPAPTGVAPALAAADASPSAPPAGIPCWRAIALPSAPNASSITAPAACTLSFSDDSGMTGNDVSWRWEAEGLPSNSDDGLRLLLPCHNAPAGTASADLSRSAAQTIVTLRATGGAGTGTAFAVETIQFSGYSGLRGTATGLRSVGSLDGAGSGFWIAGIADSDYGVRYLARPSSAPLSSSAGVIPTLVMGATVYPAGNYDPATVDVRGLSVTSSGGLRISSSYLTEPNRPGFSPWGGMIRVLDTTGSASSSNPVLPKTSDAATAILSSGFEGRGEFWGFIFEDDDRKSLWIIRDDSTYVLLDGTGDVSAGGGGAVPSLSPWWARTSEASAILHFVWSNDVARWVADPVMTALLPGEAVYSLAGRTETFTGGSGGWAMYTASRSKVFRVVPLTSGGCDVTILATAAAGTAYRGVALPPALPPTPSPSASPMPTRTSTASVSAAQLRGEKGVS